MITASGILFITPTNDALFLKRGPGGDHAGEWAFPGGKLEAGETLEQCAARECAEEIGFAPDELATMQLWTRNVSDPAQPEVAAAANTPPQDVIVVPGEQVDFTTYICRVPAQFAPTALTEHTGWAWASAGTPPEPLHPGARIALARLTMDELGIARAMAAGELTSPQKYANVTLFAMRITGTGTAYRRQHDEFVYRRPENYLTDEFLARCNGLPVIWEHPVKATLNSKEFADRIVGTIMLPYIKDDEVWGIAKMYDDAAVEGLSSQQLSTSPAVVFHNASVNSKMELENGSTLLIEGKPSLLDHLAICETGVWDKGEGPHGVESVIIPTSNGDLDVMTDEEKKADAEERERADAEAGQKLDKLLTGLDSIGSRFDSMEERLGKLEGGKADADEGEEEKKKADGEGEGEDGDPPGKPEKVVADKRKDSKKADEEEEKKADALYSKADVDEIVKKRIDEVKGMIPMQLSDADYAKFADAQARADVVFSAFNDSASRPLQGEGLTAYRKRLANKLKDHSAKWKAVDLSAIADDAAFSIIEDQIYSDAMSAALNPVDLPADELRPIHSRDTTGRQITTFAGRPGAWMRGFSSNRRRLVGIRNSRG
jgi:8-oxo-dGTP pyrophosphatase MutT (NUDIX family)